MLIQHPAALSENMVSLYFFLSPQRCRISHRRQCASLLHWNLTIPPSLWPDRELRKYHCPCLALTPPPVAIRHLLLRNRYRPDGLHGVQSKARPNRNVSVPEEWVFSKGHPDFRPYKVSLTRILRFRVGPVGALWLSLQDYLRFVLTFQCSIQPDLGKKIPRWFPNEASKIIIF